MLQMISVPLVTMVSCLMLTLASCSGAEIQSNSSPQPGTAPRTPETQSGDDTGADTNKKSFGDDNGDPNDKEGADPSEIIIRDGNNDDSGSSSDSNSSNNINDQNDNNSGSGVRESGGRGGPTGPREVAFTSSDGVRSSYKIDAPTDAHSKIYGLHIHLHGDGGGGYRDFPNRRPAHDLIGVTVKAPNTNLQWGRREGVSHARYLQDLIQDELTDKYNVDLDRIYFSGVSGGAYFLTGSFLPAFGSFYNSGAFILCGGEPPRGNIQNPSFLKRFKIYFQVTAGERQDIMSSVRASYNAYERALSDELRRNPESGFNPKSVLDSEIAGQGGHCVFDGRSYTSGIQYIIDQKFRVVLK